MDGWIARHGEGEATTEEFKMVTRKSLRFTELQVQGRDSAPCLTWSSFAAHQVQESSLCVYVCTSGEFSVWRPLMPSVDP